MNNVELSLVNVLGAEQPSAERSQQPWWSACTSASAGEREEQHGVAMAGDPVAFERVGEDPVLALWRAGADAEA